MTPRRKWIAAAFAIVSSVSCAGAVTLDFNELDHGFQFAPGDTEVKKDISGARLGFRSPGNLFAFNTGVAFPDGSVVNDPNGGICGIGADGTCAGTLKILFLDRPIADLTFNAIFADAGDRAKVIIVKQDGTRVRKFFSTSSGTEFVDFTGESDIKRLVVKSDNSTGEGYAFTNMTFELDRPQSGGSIAPVPLPAGLPLLAVGLAGFALIKRKKRST